MQPVRGVPNPWEADGRNPTEGKVHTAAEHRRCRCHATDTAYGASFCCHSGRQAHAGTRRLLGSFSDASSRRARSALNLVEQAGAAPCARALAYWPMHGGLLRQSPAPRHKRARIACMRTERWPMMCAPNGERSKLATDHVHPSRGANRGRALERTIVLVLFRAPATQHAR